MNKTSLLPILSSVSQTTYFYINFYIFGDRSSRFDTRIVSFQEVLFCKTLFAFDNRNFPKSTCLNANGLASIARAKLLPIKSMISVVMNDEKPCRLVAVSNKMAIVQESIDRAMGLDYKAQTINSLV